jgi:hypothetical protein
MVNKPILQLVRSGAHESPPFLCEERDSEHVLWNNRHFVEECLQVLRAAITSACI